MNMPTYQTLKILDFLTERQGRYKPDDKRIAGYKRLEKIDFSGTIHISEKPTKTDMILVYPGDLVISGINVAKGAVAVYQGKEPVCATIHYSSYIFDEKKVDLEYFKYFVKSPAFVSALQQQVKGGIKTEIKPKHLLPLEITIPNLEPQRQIVKQVSENFKRVEKLNEEIESQKTYTKQLRQNILQEAIEGKLTAEWRKQNPVVKGNPDFDAQALVKKIQKEKKTDRKQKNLAPITEGEMPFEIPESWKWVRLGEIVDSVVYGTSAKCSYDDKQNSRILRIPNISSGYINDDDLKFTNLSDDERKELSLKENDLLVIRSNGSSEIVGKMVYVPKSFENYCYAGYLIRLRFSIQQIGFFIGNIANAVSLRNQIEDPLRSTVGINNISSDEIKSLMFPLPPLAEQKEIVAKVESLLAKVAELENQIQERKKLSGLLMQTVLKNAFAPQE